MEEDEVISVFQEIISIEDSDGIEFLWKGIEPIRDEDAYNNFRIHLSAIYGKINCPMKIDVTTGDVITPAAIWYRYPMLFEEDTIPVMAYSVETILAEKYETIIRRNIGTTRARDFYDLYVLYSSRKDEIRPEILRVAVTHTARKRGSIEDMHDWKDIIEDIREEPALSRLWTNYTAENTYIGNLPFSTVLDVLYRIAEQLNL